MDPKTFSPDAPGSLQYDPAGFWTYHPYALPPLFRWTDRLVTAVSAADRALARLEMQVAAGPAEAVPALARLEAAASSRLAGMEMTSGQIYFAEAAGAHAPHLLSPQEQRAVALAVEYERVGTAPVLPAILRSHTRILPGQVDERWPPGEFRRGQTWIGEPGQGPAAAAFVPPPPEEMNAALEALVAFIERPARLPDLVRLALVHYQFYAIHPFYVANGRMNRLLVAWLLRAWGLLPAAALPLSRWFAARQGEMDGLLAAVSRENAWEDWLVFFLEGIASEADAARGTLQKFAGLSNMLVAGMVGERNAARLQRVAAGLVGRPCVTVSQVEAQLARGNFKSAARVVDKLVRLGVLQEQTGQGRHRVFSAPAVLGLLEG